MRIILIRHGQPHIALSPKASHAGFADYIGTYEEAGLAPSDLPPQELRECARSWIMSLPATVPAAGKAPPRWRRMPR